MSNRKFSRREYLKLQGLAAGGLALAGSAVYQNAQATETCSSKKPCIKKNAPDQQNSLFEHLETCCGAISPKTAARSWEQDNFTRVAYQGGTI